MDQQELHIFRENFLSATQVEGTIGPVTFYKIKDWGHYARSKSSLTAKRVKTDNRFKKTMQEAALLGQASACVAPVYRSLMEGWRCQEVYRKLTGIATGLIRTGNNNEAIQQALYDALAEMGYRTEYSEDELPPNLQQWLEEEQASIMMVDQQGKLIATSSLAFCSARLAASQLYSVAFSNSEVKVATSHPVELRDCKSRRALKT